MQLFLIGINLSPARYDFAEARMKEMGTTFPTLAMDTYWSFRQDDKLMLASITHAAEASHPREYRVVDPNHIVLYDGVYVDPELELAPSQAAELLRKWDDALGRIEGQFIAIRLAKDRNRLELYCDHMGFYQAYVCEYAGGWLISNSIRLLTRVRQRFALDPTGVAMSLSYGIAFGDRTLQEGIRTIPGGHLVTWNTKDKTHTKKLYFIRTDWARAPGQAFEKLNIDGLATRMALPMKQLADVYGPLDAPITAGHDSRLMMALLHSVGADAHYFSAGRRDLKDVTIGKTLANHFHLPHRWVDLMDNGVIENWERLTDRLMLQTDGLVTLAHLTNIYNTPIKINRLPVHLYGAGGEFGKSLYVNLDFYLSKHSVNSLGTYLIKLYEKKKAVFTCERAYDIGRSNLRSSLNDLSREGFPNSHLLLAYFAFNRFPRWAGSSFKCLQPHADVYSPFCTPTFVATAFGLAPIRRYCHSLHYQLIAHCLPELHKLPIEKAFGTQKANRNIAKMVYAGVREKAMKAMKALRNQNTLTSPLERSRQHQRMKWLFSTLKPMRSVCLDQSNSLIWDFLNREAFEKATAPGVDMTYAGQHQKELFQLFTLFAYSNSADA